MGVSYNRKANDDLKNYIVRTGIADRSRREDLYLFIQHIIDLDVYDDIYEMYICQSPYNDQSQSKVMAFKNAERDGIPFGTFLNWDESGIETDNTCGWESPFGYTEPSILSLFKMTSSSFTTTGDNPISIYNQTTSGIRDSLIIRYGSTGTGGTSNVYPNIYDNQGQAGAASPTRMRHGIRIQNYNTAYNNKFAFIGYSYPFVDLDDPDNDFFEPIGGILRNVQIEDVRLDIPDHNSGGTVRGYNYLSFTSQSSANTAQGYHTVHIFFKQSEENFAYNGIYQSIMDKMEITICKNLTLPNP